MLKNIRSIRTGATMQSIQWTGDNLAEVIKFTGLHGSVSDMQFADYKALVDKKGFKLFITDNIHCMVDIGSYIVKNGKGAMRVFKEARYFDLFSENS